MRNVLFLNSNPKVPLNKLFKDLLANLLQQFNTAIKSKGSDFAGKDLYVQIGEAKSYSYSNANGGLARVVIDKSNSSGAIHDLVIDGRLVCTMSGSSLGRDTASNDFYIPFDNSFSFADTSVYSDHRIKYTVFLYINRTYH